LTPDDLTPGGSTAVQLKINEFVRRERPRKMRRGQQRFGNKHVATGPPRSAVIAFFAEHSTPLTHGTIILETA
jgi:hypothetical protein